MSKPGISEEEHLIQFKKCISTLLAACETAQKKGAFSFEESFEILHAKAFLIGGKQSATKLNEKSQEFFNYITQKEKENQKLKESVTTEKSSEESVTTEKSSEESVTTEKSSEESVTTEKSSEESVTTEKSSEESVN